MMLWAALVVVAIMSVIVFFISRLARPNSVRGGAKVAATTTKRSSIIDVEGAIFLAVVLAFVVGAGVAVWKIIDLFDDKPAVVAEQPNTPIDCVSFREIRESVGVGSAIKKVATEWYTGKQPDLSRVSLKQQCYQVNKDDPGVYLMSQGPTRDVGCRMRTNDPNLEGWDVWDFLNKGRAPESVTLTPNWAAFERTGMRSILILCWAM